MPGAEAALVIHRSAHEPFLASAFLTSFCGSSSILKTSSSRSPPYPSSSNSWVELTLKESNFLRSFGIEAGSLSSVGLLGVVSSSGASCPLARLRRSVLDAYLLSESPRNVLNLGSTELPSELQAAKPKSELLRRNSASRADSRLATEPLRLCG
jgi:hypothetical protein